MPLLLCECISMQQQKGKKCQINDNRMEQQKKLLKGNDNRMKRITNIKRHRKLKK